MRERKYIYTPLFTNPEGDSCFSIYQIGWIKKRFFNFFFWNFREDGLRDDIKFWLIDWSIDRSIDRSIDWLIDWLKEIVIYHRVHWELHGLRFCEQSVLGSFNLRSRHLLRDGTFSLLSLSKKTIRAWSREFATKRVGKGSISEHCKKINIPQLRPGLNAVIRMSRT